MADFKVGDKVRRINTNWGSVKLGDVYTVAADCGRTLNLEEVGGGFLSCNFEKVLELPVGHIPATPNVVADSLKWVDDKPQGERDPSGIDQHTPGAKVDAGKVRPSLIIEGMARALWEVAAIGTFGAAKYTDGGWVLVPNGQARYADAQYRHILKRAMGEAIDPDSEKLHLAHEAWNALAKLDLYLREQEKVKVA